MTQDEQNKQSHIFRAGGSLAEDAPSYVQRCADTELYDALLQGEFCYILTSRQMGKSSLMVRTAARLRQNDIRVAALDVTAVGLNLSAEQWYFGLLDILAEQLGLEDELEAFWEQHANLGPLRRFMVALQTIALPAQPSALVIFVDEIDAVRQLPFSADEFFAAIRECYNQRTQNKDLERLTFCLIGVASPSDLIEDTRMTPFNIGKRIDLTDFTEEEVAFFAEALSGYVGQAKSHVTAQGRPLIQRVLYWTGGQPYLTQRLCKALAESVTSTTSKDVDSFCRTLFLSEQAREQDSNLTFVRERILRSDADRVELLNRYRDVIKGKRVPDDENNPLTSILKLAGIVRVEKNRLRVRNRIYNSIFNQAWTRDHMPDAEKRRERAAYRAGTIRATTVYAVVILVMGVLAVMALSEKRKAEANAARIEAVWALTDNDVLSAEVQLAKSLTLDDRLDTRERLLEARVRGPRLDWVSPKMEGNSVLGISSDARQAVVKRKDGRLNLWDIHKHSIIWEMPVQTQTVLCVAFCTKKHLLVTGHEGGSVQVWNTQTSTRLWLLPGRTDVLCLALSYDGTIVASASDDRTIRLWDVRTGRKTSAWIASDEAIGCLAFSHDGQTLASGGWDKLVWLWNTATNTKRVPRPLPKRHTDNVVSLAFSPDGQYLASGSWDTSLWLWDMKTGKSVRFLFGHKASVLSLAFIKNMGNENRGYLASGDLHGDIRLWNTETGKNLLTLTGHQADVIGLAFNDSGDKMVSGSQDGEVRVWDLGIIDRKSERYTLRGHTDVVGTLAYSEDGRYLASGSDDRTVRVWDTRTHTAIYTFSGHTKGMWALAFSPDGSLLASGSRDKKARLWNMATGKEWGKPLLHDGPVNTVCFRCDGRLLATGGDDNTIRLWEPQTGKLVHKISCSSSITRLAFSPDGRRLAGGAMDGSIHIWDMQTYKVEVQALHAHERVRNGGLWGLAFSPNGHLLASGGDDKTVRLWDAHSLRGLDVLRIQKSAIYDISFRPDGRAVAAASQDGTVRIWDIQTRNLFTLYGYASIVWSAVYSPDGRYLASGGQDGAVWIWDMEQIQNVLSAPPAELLTQAEQKTGLRVTKAGVVSVLQQHSMPIRKAILHPVIDILPTPTTVDSISHLIQNASPVVSS